jgi:SAM-dependent methyltransferase
MTTHEVYSSTPAIRRFNAWFFDTFDGFIDWSTRRAKKRLFSDIPRTLVEIGPGVGANFRYYQPGTRVIAIEPNEAMHSLLRARALDAELDLDLRSSLAEETGLLSDSVEAVVSSLVLCTVRDQGAAAAEIFRILKPGGRLLILEHVESRDFLLRLIQRLLARPWRWLFEGCELRRDTLSVLSSAGLKTEGISTKTLVTAFIPVNSMILGEAVK